MKKLIINADDFGYRQDINEGIIFSHQNGLVSSTSLLINKEAAEDAVAQSKDNPNLGIGLHLDLDKFFEVDHKRGIVTNWISKHNLGEVVDEAKKQIDKYLSFGFKPIHVDSHHHAHMRPELFELVCKLCKDSGFKVIRIFEKNNINDFKKTAKSHNLKFTDNSIEGWYMGHIDQQHKVEELITHPGYGELWREAELAHCCHPDLREQLNKSNIEVIKFSDLSD
ncbi:carbohydrate deacetylase [Elusimicrobiota bacterium]